MDNLTLPLPIDHNKAAKPANAADEDVVPRFTLGLQARPRRHLVPLPWQPEQSANKESN